MEGRSIRVRPVAASRLRGALLGAAAALAGIGALGFALAARGGDLSSQLALVGVGFPLVVASGFFAARRPAWAVAAATALMAFAGTLATNQGVQPKLIEAAVWLLVLGLAAAVIGGRLNAVAPRPVAIWPGIAALGAYLVFTALQIPFAETNEIGLKAFIAGPAFIIAFFALSYSQWGAGVRWRVAQAFALVALLVGAYSLFRLIGGPTGAELAVNRESGGVAGELALLGPFGSRQQLGAWTGVAIPFLFAFALASRGRWRWIGAAATALLLVALLGSEVRIGLVAAAVGISVVAFMFQGQRALRGQGIAALFAIVAIAVAGMVGFAFTVGSDTESTQRYENILSPEDDRSFQARLRKWDVTLEGINEHPFGEGLGTTGSTQRLYSRTYRIDNRYIDNTYLQLGVQQGYPGWILFGLSMVLIGYMLLRSTFAARDRRIAALGIGACGMLATLLVLLISGDMLTVWGAFLFWILLGLAVGGFVSGTAGDPARAQEDVAPGRP